MICDFCQTRTENVYAHVHLCPRCGLVQNEPRSDRTVSTTCGPDQGNLRNGKAFRFPLSLPILESIDWDRIRTAVDIGSNRGAFVRWLRENYPHVNLTAVEPEERLVDYDDALIGRFEDFAPSLGRFDFVFCSHTIEHARSASAMFSVIEQATHIGSQMLLELPNLATIQDPRVVEQFFIFKHNFHFSTSLLIPYLLDLGFKIEQDETTMFDIRLLLRKELEAFPFRAFDFAVQPTRDWIADYQRNMERNWAALPKVTARLHELARHKHVAYWGAGRIFDALCQYGNLDPNSGDLVDGLLQGVVTEVHGVPVRDPSILALTKPDVIVVLGRTSSDELVTRAGHYAPEVLTFNDLLDEVV